MVGTIAKFSVDEYHRMIEAGVLDDRNVELLEGLIIEMAPEGIPHAYHSDESGDYLSEALGKRAKVREGKPITLDDSSEPQPDLAIVEPLGEVYSEHHPYPENVFWLIEYSDSSLKKDLEQKARIYAKAGIKEYWVINLKKNELIVFRSLANGEYQKVETLTQGTISPLDFPEVSFSVPRLAGRKTR